MEIPSPVEEILLHLDSTAKGDAGNIDDDTRNACKKSARIIRSLYKDNEINVEESTLDS